MYGDLRSGTETVLPGHRGVGASGDDRVGMSGHGCVGECGEETRGPERDEEDRKAHTQRHSAASLEAKSANLTQQCASSCRGA